MRWCARLACPSQPYIYSCFFVSLSPFFLHPFFSLNKKSGIFYDRHHTCGLATCLARLACGRLARRRRSRRRRRVFERRRRAAPTNDAPGRPFVVANAAEGARLGGAMMDGCVEKKRVFREWASRRATRPTSGRRWRRTSSRARRKVCRELKRQRGRRMMRDHDAFLFFFCCWMARFSPRTRLDSRRVLPL